MSLNLSNALTYLITDYATIYENTSINPITVKLLVSNTTSTIQHRFSIRLVKADMSTFIIMNSINLFIGQAFDINLPVILEAGDRLEGIVLDVASYNGVCVLASAVEYSNISGMTFDSVVQDFTTSYATIYTGASEYGSIAKIAIANTGDVEDTYSIRIRVGGVTNKIIAQSIYLPPYTTEFIEHPIILGQYDLLQIIKSSASSSLVGFVNVETKTI